MPLVAPSRWTPGGRRGLGRVSRSSSRSRLPAVDGLFYPSDEASLLHALDWCVAHPLGPGVGAQQSAIVRAQAAIAPHAGLVYSGPVAAHAHAAIAGAEDVIVLGPNHRRLGAAIAVSGADAWLTPLGPLSTSRYVVDHVLSRCPAARVDDPAHLREHSIELQAVFLRYFGRSAVRLAAIAVGDADPDSLYSLGTALAELLLNPKLAILATTDLSHYLPDAAARAVDDTTIADILSLDVGRLESDRLAERAQLCGFGAVAATMWAARLAGLDHSSLLARCTSADTGSDSNAVVGYASISFVRASGSAAPTSIKSGVVATNAE